MLTLFINGTLLDNLTNVMKGLRDDNQIMMWVFVIFILVSSFTVLNMLIGVLCEVVTATSDAEGEMATQSAASIILKRVFKEIDTDKSGLISMNEFDQMKENEDAIAALGSLGIEMHMVNGLRDVLFQADDEEDENPQDSPQSGGHHDLPPGTKELTFKEFLERLSHLKPGTGVSVLDFADLQKQLQQSSRKVERRIKELQRRMATLGAPIPSIDPNPSNPMLEDVSKADS